jgi:hypothetical protein
VSQCISGHSGGGREGLHLLRYLLHQLTSTGRSPFSSRPPPRPRTLVAHAHRTYHSLPGAVNPPISRPALCDGAVLGGPEAADRSLSGARSGLFCAQKVPKSALLCTRRLLKGLRRPSGGHLRSERAPFPALTPCRATVCARFRKTQSSGLVERRLHRRTAGSSGRLARWATRALGSVGRLARHSRACLWRLSCLCARPLPRCYASSGAKSRHQRAAATLRSSFAT